MPLFFPKPQPKLPANRNALVQSVKINTMSFMSKGVKSCSSCH